MITFKPLGTTEIELNELVKLGLKYDKRQKRQMLAAGKSSPPEKHQVTAFENAICHPLPGDYRKFLLEKNGGIPSKSKVRTYDNMERIVQHLYALTNQSKQFTIGHFLEVYRNRLPTTMLPIGDDPAGNLFLIGIADDQNYGKVFFWDHEQEADMENQPYAKNISIVAQSFSEFLNKLQ